MKRNTIAGICVALAITGWLSTRGSEITFQYRVTQGMIAILLLVAVLLFEWKKK